MMIMMVISDHHWDTMPYSSMKGGKGSLKNVGPTTLHGLPRAYAGAFTVKENTNENTLIKHAGVGPVFKRLKT